MSQQFIKLVLVGDGAVGKTCLIHVYTQNCFPTEYIPTVFDNYTSSLELNNKLIQLAIFDTAGQQDFDSVRPLSYPGAHVFMLCYAVNQVNNFNNVKTKWAKEIRHFNQEIPIVLLGNKIDLLSDQEVIQQLAKEGLKPISQEQGEAMKKQIGAAAHVMASAKEMRGVKEAFETCCRAAMGLLGAPKKKGFCGTK